MYLWYRQHSMPFLQVSTCKCAYESSHDTTSMCARQNPYTTTDIITITRIGNEGSIHVIPDVITIFAGNKTPTHLIQYIIIVINLYTRCSYILCYKYIVYHVPTWVTNQLRLFYWYSCILVLVTGTQSIL